MYIGTPEQNLEFLSPFHSGVCVYILLTVSLFCVNDPHGACISIVKCGKFFLEIGLMKGKERARRERKATKANSIRGIVAR